MYSALELYVPSPGLNCSYSGTDALFRLVPFGQATLKCLPALLAGNACILKPSPFTPYSALKLVEIAQQVLPPGLLQVLGGDEQLGPWLTNHADINKISFTGSTATGKKVMQAAAGTLKRVTLEL